MTREQALARQEAARKAFQEADDAWSAELERVFGKRAGDMRYAPQGKGQVGTRLLELHYYAYEAREALRDAADFAREFSNER